MPTHPMRRYEYLYRKAASRVNALAAGDVHLITEVSSDQIASIAGLAGFQVVGGPINNIRCLNYGSMSGPLADVRIRRALNLSIDRKLIAEQLYGGRVSVPKGYQWPAYGDVFIADFPEPAFDLTEAKKLLAEAGYKNEVIEYRTQSNYYTAELVTAQVLQQMWQAAGINVQLKVCENWSQVFAQPNGAIFNGSINMVYPDFMGSIFVLFGPNGFIRNQAKSWQNADFDSLGQKLAETTDRKVRRELHLQALKLMADIDPPGTVLFENPMFYGKRADLAWSPYRNPMMDFGPFNAA